MYSINYNGRYYEVLDSRGRFVCSADTESEAEEDIKELQSMSPMERKFKVSYLKARAKWITQQGKKLQVPIEESYPVVTTVNASSPQEAINKVIQPGYITTNIQVI
jgi:hypothetical protein